MCFSRVDHGTDDEGRSGGTAVKKGVILTSIVRGKSDNYSPRNMWKRRSKNFLNYE